MQHGGPRPRVGLEAFAGTVGCELEARSRLHFGKVVIWIREMSEHVGPKLSVWIVVKMNQEVSSNNNNELCLETRRVNNDHLEVVDTEGRVR